MTPEQVIESAIESGGYTFTDRSARYSWVDIEDHVINSLRASGYVIKRAVPPCRGYDFEDKE